jgi:hypothetical protein
MTTSFAVSRLPPLNVGDSAFTLAMRLPPGTSIDRFRANPVLLWAHAGENLARISELRATPDGLSLHADLDVSRPDGDRAARHVAGKLVQWAEAAIDETGSLVEISLSPVPVGAFPDEPAQRADVAEATSYVDGCACSPVTGCTCPRFDENGKGPYPMTREEKVSLIQMFHTDFNGDGRSDAYLAAYLAECRRLDAESPPRAKQSAAPESSADDDARLDALDAVEQRARDAMDSRNRLRGVQPLPGSTESPAASADRVARHAMEARRFEVASAERRNRPVQHADMADDEPSPEARAEALEIARGFGLEFNREYIDALARYPSLRESSARTLAERRRLARPISPFSRGGGCGGDAA